MTSITHAKLDWNESGTPVSDQFDDVYFSNVNGLEETRYVFLQQNQLPTRWQTINTRRFVIAETGFGTGLNFLAVWQSFQEFRRQYPEAPLKELHFISFEKYPVNRTDLIRAHQAWPELKEFAEPLQRHYPAAVPDCHRLVLAQGAITLDLWFGDIKECLPKVPTPEQGIVDCWFLDGFAPSKNPEMWSQTLFNGMAMLAKQDCTCATFTAAGFVRRGLIDAGFDMKKVKGFGTKREMIAGSLTVKKSYNNIDALYPQVSASDSDDIAIIGGGIASATLAQSLEKRGKKVTLYCQDSAPAQGASGNRQGAVYPLINGEHQGVSRIFAPAFIYARQFIEQAAEQLAFDHQWCGVTQLMWDETSSKKLTKMLNADLPSSVLCHLNREQTSDTIGLPVDCESVYYPLGGWLCPAQLTEQLLNSLEKAGKLTAHYQHKVTALSFDASSKQWHLEIEEQQAKRFVSHSTIVIANGHAFQQLAPTAQLHLTPVKGQVSHIPTSPTLEKLKSVICYDGYLTPHNPKLKTHCIGASYDRQHINTEFDPLAQRDNAQKIRDCIPNQKWVEDIDITDDLSRQGIRCVSRDHLPFVGPVVDTQKLQAVNDKGVHKQLPLHDNLYCFLGLGSRGLSSAPLLGELLASQICGDPLPLPIEPLKTLHPARTWAKRLKKGKPLGL